MDPFTGIPEDFRGEIGYVSKALSLTPMKERNLDTIEVIQFLFMLSTMQLGKVKCQRILGSRFTN